MDREPPAPRKHPGPALDLVTPTYEIAFLHIDTIYGIRRMLLNKGLNVIEEIDRTAAAAWKRTAPRGPRAVIHWLRSDERYEEALWRLILAVRAEGRLWKVVEDEGFDETNWQASPSARDIDEATDVIVDRVRTLEVIIGGRVAAEVGRSPNAGTTARWRPRS